MDELLKIPSCVGEKSSQLRYVYDKVSIHVRGLESLGVTAEQYGSPRGVLPNKEVGGLAPNIKFGGKIWGKVRPSSPNKTKNLRSSVTTRRKSWEKSQFWGHI